MADRATRKKQITERRQSQILQAASDIFTRKGYAAATVPEIARLAGIASGTVYLYYPSKRDLFIAVITQTLMAPLLRILNQSDHLNFIDLLNGAINDRLTLMQQETFPRMLSLMGEIQRDEELRALYAEQLVTPLLKNMAGYFHEHIVSGEFHQENPELLVRLVAGTVIGMIILRVLEGPASPLNKMPMEFTSAAVRNFILFGVKREKEKEEKNK
jgi:AcrR family transcriptional regulator